MNKTLQKQLIEMQSRDQRMRKSGNWDNRVDRKNTDLLKRIVKKYGWPHILLVGKKASNSAWLIAQHADHDVNFQKECLKLMNDTKIKKNITPSNIAYLTDRIRVHEGRKQIYGTQFYTTTSGRFVPRPIHDKKNLNKRRRTVGLESFEEYQKRLSRIVNKIDRKIIKK